MLTPAESFVFSTVTKPKTKLASGASQRPGGAWIGEPLLVRCP